MKIFRDPIHNVIDLDTGDKDVNRLIIQLIDSVEFQRLRFIRQLGFVYLAYPSATHTRFEHSIGVAFLAKRFIDKIISVEERVLSVYGASGRHVLANFFWQIKQDRCLTIVAALLHDIGHGAFSHVFEDITGTSHEQWTREIILGDTSVNALLKAYDADYPQKICNLLINPDKSTPSAQIIAGQMDIDKIDYLLRDSHMTGSGYGKFDVEWLFNVLTVGLVNGRAEIGLDEGKGGSLAEDFVMARIYMFKNIYLHKTSQVAQAMLKLLIKAMPTRLEPMNDSIYKLLFHEHAPPGSLLAEYLSVSDIDMLHFLKTLAGTDDEVLSGLAGGIVNRNLFKRVGEQQWHETKKIITEEKGSQTAEFYLATFDLNNKKEKMICHPEKENIFLFNKCGECSGLFEKSSILPTTIQEGIFPTEYYVDRRFT